MSAGYGALQTGKPSIRVLSDVNIVIERGKTVGVIGESGCGKSTLARVFAGLLSPFEGDILLHGNKLAPSLTHRQREELRKIQFVYQMADTALNPKQKIKDILGRPVEFYKIAHGQNRRQRVAELLDLVELPQQFAERYPRELSGGQQQRVNLARALAANPEVILCDEVTSALDTIVGANVIELLKRLRRETGVAFVFISHDLSTIASFADQIVVLYAGRVVEQGDADQVLSPPYHPYTRLLVSSVPEMRLGWLTDITQNADAMKAVGKDVDLNAKGCVCYNRCPLAIKGRCDTQIPVANEDGFGHKIACHRTTAELGAT